MTKREAYEFVIANVDNKEVAELFTKELTALDLKNAKAKAKRIEKSEADQPLVDKVVEALANGGKVTAAGVGQALEVSTSKAVALLKKAGAVKLGTAKVSGKTSTVWGFEA